MCALRILIVEDDPDIADLLQATLEPPFECLRASNGLEGFQMALEGEPDLVISDIMMPLMDGYDFISRLRREAAFAQLPVIFLSALGSKEQIRKGYDLGATLYLTKPIDPSRLKRNIELFIKDHGISTGPKKRPTREVAAAVAASQPRVPLAAAASDAAISEEDPTTRRRRAQAAAVKPVPAPAEDEPTTRRRQAMAAAGAAPPEAAGENPATDKPRMVVRASSPLAAQMHSARAKVRIMVVEDDRDALEAIRSGLEARYEVVLALDGLEAIERAVRYKPDIFVIDGMLPRMTGYQLVGMLKKNSAFRAAPVIFISGRATARDRQYVEKIGVKHFLPKPFEIGQMARLLEKITAEPDFAIFPERVSIHQAHLEAMRDFDVHRAEAPRGPVVRTVKPDSSPKRD